MAQLSVTREPENAPLLAERIRNAIEQAQLDKAKRLLLDYARETGNKGARDDALVLAWRLENARHDQDLLGKDTSAERSAVIAGMLDLLRRIEDNERTTPPEPPVPVRRPVSLAPVPADEPPPYSPTEAATTRLERARLDFENSSRRRPAE